MSVYYATKWGEHSYWDPDSGLTKGYDVYLSNTNTDYSYTWTELTEWNNNPCYDNYVKEIFLTEDWWEDPETGSYELISAFFLDLPNNTTSLFSGCMNETIPNIDKIKVRYCDDFIGMFSHCPNLKYVDCRNWKTDDILAIDQMFYDCPNLEEVDLRGWTSWGKIWACENIFSDDVKLHTIRVDPDTDWSVQMDTGGWEHRFENLFVNCPSLPDWPDAGVDIGGANDRLPEGGDDWHISGGYFRHDFNWMDFDVYEKAEGEWKRAYVKQKSSNRWVDATPMMLEY